MFFEASTRTQASFEIAGKRLGADVMNMSDAGQFPQEGRDADRHRDDAERDASRLLVVRHPHSGAVTCWRRR
jgi:aspartate carbamoyltransferase catalytic subunit